MSNDLKRISWFGIVLVVLGAVMLLDRLHAVDIGFSTAFWPLIALLGMVMVVRGFSLNRRGKVFWGTVIFLFALLFFLRSSDYFEVRAHAFPAAVFLIFGIAFLMTFVNDARDWAMLIPAFVLGGLGTLLILLEYGYVYRWNAWEVGEALRLYWPLILVAIGLALLLRRGTRQDSKQSTQ